ncbi:MAG TPA: hypothetical protein VMU29_14960 [Smithella sp.]|nr:hypothetical protein [Smithella sp.]
MKTTTELLKEQLTDFKDACKIEGLNPRAVIPGFYFFPENDRQAMRKLSELVIIIRTANRIANGGKEWIPDYDDSNEKLEPRFRMFGKGGSSGFPFGGCAYWASASAVGSRLCFINDEVGNYVVETFLDHYRAFFVKS